MLGDEIRLGPSAASPSSISSKVPPPCVSCTIREDVSRFNSRSDDNDEGERAGSTEARLMESVVCEAREV